MQTQTNDHYLKRGWLRLVTFALAALAGASATAWALKLSAQASPAPTTAPAIALALTDPQTLARVLGGGVAGTAALSASVAPPLSTRFKLMGVVAGPAPKGYALIAIDGKPAKPYRVGAQLEEALMLQSVASRSATLAASLKAPAGVMLELPKINP